ncbi:multidrug transporter subunit MdtA, partial [Acinetobacter baumannii]
ANEDGALFPNQFVNVRLLLDVRRGATVIPTAAIQRAGQNAFVYAITPENRIAVRQVTLGPLEGNRTIIETGLQPGDQVVTDGGDRLREGT